MSTEVIGGLPDDPTLPKLTFISQHIVFKLDKVIFDIELVPPNYDDYATRGKNAIVKLFVERSGQWCLLFTSSLKQLWETRRYFDESRLGNERYLREFADEVRTTFETLKIQEVLNG